MQPVLVFRQVAHEGLGTIADALSRREIPFDVVDALAQDSLDVALEKYSGLVVMGGPMNVDETDRYPALTEQVKYLQMALLAEMPILGICLGSQLLAKALGSKVFPNRIKEIGWYDLELLPAATDDRLFRHLPAPATVFQWHGDTFDLPRGAVQLARSALCENQAFRYGRTAYALQFHLEVDAEIVERWLCESGNCGELAELDYIDPAVIRRDTPAKLPAMQSFGAKVFDEFASMCVENGR
jgi:GMP synthase (glutamine-hydrolysing)